MKQEDQALSRLSPDHHRPAEGSGLGLEAQQATTVEEACPISARTGAVLMAVRMCEGRPASPRLQGGTSEQADLARRAHVARAKAWAAEVLPIIREAQTAGATSLRAIAAALMLHGVRTARGRGAWYPAQVRRVLAHSEGAEPRS